MILAFLIESGWLILGVHLPIRGRTLRPGVCEPAVLHLLSEARLAVESPVNRMRAELMPSSDLDELAQLDDVVIDRFSTNGAALRRLISALKLGGVRIYSADHVYELLTGRLSLHQTEDSFLNDSSGKVLYALVKRVLDLGGELALLLIAAVPMGVIAGLIRASSSGPVLFRQARVGVHGRTFEMLKFGAVYLRADDRDRPSPRAATKPQAGSPRSGFRCASSPSMNCRS